MTEIVIFNRKEFMKFVMSIPDLNTSDHVDKIEVLYSPILRDSAYVCGKVIDIEEDFE